MSRKDKNKHSLQDADPPAALSDGPESEPTPEPADEIERLRAELEAAREQRLRALADLQNFHRQSLVNEREAREEGAGGVMQGVITVLDHFDLALSQDAERASAAAVLDGVRLIQDELVRVLREHGAQRLEPRAGAAFDPHLHEAVGCEAAAGVAPGAVVRTLQPGYTLGERLLRPAKVMVAPSDDSPSGSENTDKIASDSAEE